MTKLEKFITDNFYLQPHELEYIPRLVKRCKEEINDSENNELSEYSLYDIVDDELVMIESETLKK